MAQQCSLVLEVHEGQASRRVDFPTLVLLQFRHLGWLLLLLLLLFTVVLSMLLLIMLMLRCFFFLLVWGFSPVTVRRPWQVSWGGSRTVPGLLPIPGITSRLAVMGLPGSGAIPGILRRYMER